MHVGFGVMQISTGCTLAVIFAIVQELEADLWAETERMSDLEQVALFLTSQKMLNFSSLTSWTDK